MDGNFLFALKGQVVIGKLDFQRTLIDDFLKTIAKCGMDFHGGGDDATGQLFVFHTLMSLIVLTLICLIILIALILTSG